MQLIVLYSRLKLQLLKYLFLLNNLTNFKNYCFILDCFNKKKKINTITYFYIQHQVPLFTFLLLFICC